MPAIVPPVARITTLASEPCVRAKEGLPSAVPSPALRSARLLQLAAWLRASVGPSYPLGAIIPSPRGMQLSPSYWPGFPFSSLAQSFDVIVQRDGLKFFVSQESLGIVDGPGEVVAIIIKIDVGIL